jgi:topoisomerase-4 subunit A
MVHLSNMANARIKQFEYDFSTLAIKGKTSKGNLLTKYPVRKIELKEKGISTLGGIHFWWDSATGRINTDGYGKELGEFYGEDLLLILSKAGEYELVKPEANRRFDASYVEIIQKFYPNQAINAVHEDGKSGKQYVKRFLIETTTLDKAFLYISEEKKSKLLFVSTNSAIELLVTTENKKKEKSSWVLNFEEFIDIKGWKALGNRLSPDKLKKIKHTGELIGEAPPRESQNISENVDKNSGQMNLL